MFRPPAPVLAALLFLAALVSAHPIQAQTHAASPFRDQGKFGFRHASGQVVIAPKYDEAYLDPDADLYRVRLDGKWGLVDKSGREITAPAYDAMMKFQNGVYIVTRDGKRGVVDSTGREIIPTLYRSVFSTGDRNRFVAVNDGETLHLDRSGGVVSRTATQAPAKAPAATPSARPPAAPDELSEHTREATNWDEFFTASARRGITFHVRHLTDVRNFRQRHPATPAQLRDAYRRAQATFRPTPGTDLGLERGTLFVAYTVALGAAGLDEAAVLNHAREDFLRLAQTDSHGAYQALVGVETMAPWRDMLPPAQNQRVREISRIVVNRQPFPKVPGGAPAASTAVAPAPAPQPATAPAATPAPTGTGVPHFAPRGSTTSIAGHWDLSTQLQGARRITGQVRFEGGDGVVRAVVFDPLSNTPRRGNASVAVSGAGTAVPGQRILSFYLGDQHFTGVFNPGNLWGQILRGRESVGSWSATRRIDLDYLVVARAAGKSPEALAAFDAAIRENPLTSHRMERAGWHYDARNYALAIADYDEVLKATPNLINARLNRMLSYYYSRQHEAALADADHVLRLNLVPTEQRALTHFMRGEILWWLERNDEAERAYTAAIELDPKLAERNRVANTREGALARMAASAAQVNAIMTKMDAGIAQSAAQLKAANATSTAAATTTTGTALAPEIPLSSSQQVLALYETLQSRLAAAALGSDDPVLAEALDTVAPLITPAREILDQGYAEVRRAFAAAQPAGDLNLQANRAFHAGDQAGAIRLWEQAAAQGNADALANLAVQREGAPAESTRATEPDAYRDLLLRAAEAGSPDAYTRLASYFYHQGPGRDLARAADYARRAVAVGHFPSGYYHYLSVHNLLSEAARQPAQAARPDPAAIAAAVQDLAKAALHGHAAAMYSLGNYHLSGRLPGSRAVIVTHSSPEYTAFNVPLARFWLQQATARPDDLNERGRELAAQALARAEQALALIKGREWAADEVIAALDAGVNHNTLALLIARDGASFTRGEHTRILTSPAGSKLAEYGLLLFQLGNYVVSGPENAAEELAAAAIAERRRTATPLPDPGTDLAALRRGFEAGDPAAAYALFLLSPKENFGAWPEAGPPRDRVIEVALSRDYAPAQHLRIGREKLDHRTDPAQRDLPRAFALALDSARAGSAEAARLVADYYRGDTSGTNPVRPNIAEAEWWYAQAAALAWPDQFKGPGSAVDPARSLALLYSFERSGPLMNISLNASAEATLRWVRELRRRGGAAQTLADEKVAYWGTADAGRRNIEPLVAALPPALPPFAADQLARLEREAAAGQPAALRTLAHALAHGEGGLRQDDARAAALYRRAAEAGDTEAMTALADMYAAGHGVKIDLATAAEWRARAGGQVH